MAIYFMLTKISVSILEKTATVNGFGRFLKSRDPELRSGSFRFSERRKMRQPVIDMLDIGGGLKMRYGIWPFPGSECRGSVLLLNGRAEFLEKHLETVCDLLERGFDVYSLDWRGQGLSTRMLENPHKGHVVCFEDYIHDLELFVRNVMGTATRPRTILAHSMGAHIALRFIREHDGFANRAVLVSAMCDIHTFPLPGVLARRIVKWAAHSGRKDRYLPGDGDYRKKLYFANPYTSDPVRFQDEHRAIARNPALALGGPTCGWAAAAFDSIDQLRSSGFAEAVHTPVLMIAGRRDRVVRLDALKAISRRLPLSRLLVLKGARHEILKETDAVRKRFWELFDGFLRKG